MMYGVRFNGLHSYDYFGMYMAEKPIISDPEPKYIMVDVPGSDGEIDLTESMTGSVKFNNRKITIVLRFLGTSAQQTAAKAKLSSHVHGKTVNVIFDEDPDYYYRGRIKLSEIKRETLVMDITLEMDAEPFKLEHSSTILSKSFASGSSSRTRILNWTYMQPAPTGVCDMRFGSQQIPLGNFAPYSSLELVFTVLNGAQGHRVALCDKDYVMDVHRFEKFFPAQGGGTASLTVTKQELVDAGYDPSTVFKIYLENCIPSSVQLYGVVGSSVMIEFDAGDKPSVPIIHCNAGVSIIKDGKSYSFSSLKSYNEDLVTDRGVNQWAAVCDDKTASMSMTFQRGWL